MSYLIFLLLLPIAYVLIGAAVLATLDWDGEFFRFCQQRDSAVLAIMLWPISAWAILSGRKKLKPAEKIESPKNF